MSKKLKPRKETLKWQFKTKKSSKLSDPKSTKIPAIVAKIPLQFIKDFMHWRTKKTFLKILSSKWISKTLSILIYRQRVKISHDRHRLTSFFMETLYVVNKKVKTFFKPKTVNHWDLKRQSTLITRSMQPKDSSESISLSCKDLK